MTDNEPESASEEEELLAPSVEEVLDTDEGQPREPEISPAGGPQR